jgi:hypothetical protein
VSFSFDTSKKLIVVSVKLFGPTGIATVRMALDTGASTTLVNTGLLVSIGYDPALIPDRLQVSTGSGVEFLPLIELKKITALGKSRNDFPVLGHTLPPSTSVDGLLGIDFFRDLKLTVDFCKGKIDLD